MSYLVGFGGPIVGGVIAHYIARRKLHPRFRKTAEAVGWVTTAVLAVFAFPREWRDLEFFTLAALLWYALAQVLLCVIFLPIVRWSNRPQ